MKQIFILLFLTASIARAGGDVESCVSHDASNDPYGLVESIAPSDWTVCAIFDGSAIATKEWSVRVTIGPKGNHIQKFSLSSKNATNVSGDIYETCKDVTVGASEVLSVVRGASDTPSDLIPVRACARDDGKH